MAVYLPDGSTVSLATTYGDVKTISAVSNANPAVVTSAAHGYSDGDFVEIITSSWSRMDGRVFRVASSTTDAFALEGFDTSDTAVFNAGGGAGTCKEITAFTQVAQITKFDVTGGEQQFASYSFLEDDSEKRIPTITSSMNVELAVGDDPALPGQVALNAAGEARAIRALKLVNKNGSIVLYNGYVSFNSTPTMSKGNIMECSGGLALRNKPVRYAA